MKYRTARRLIMVLGIAALLLALSLLVFIENAAWVNTAIWLIMALIAAAAVIRIFFCRCPHCGGYIKHFYSHCPNCGAAINEND